MKQDVWVIAKTFVVEAYLGGMQLGEVADLDMSSFNVVAELSQSEIDEMFEEYYKENGHYPDT
jgi:hypothetical protein